MTAGRGEFPEAEGAAWPANRGILWTAAIVAAACVVWFGSRQPSQAPRLFDIELSFTPGAFAQRVNAWVHAFREVHGPASDALSAFRHDILVDFVFIPAYAVFLAGLYRWLARTASLPVRMIVPLACAAAALFDCVENAGLLWLTSRPVTPADVNSTIVAATSIASAFKWSALALVAIFLVRAFVAGYRGKVLMLSRYGLLSIALGTIPLVATGQGRDLITALADKSGSPAHRSFFFLTLAVWGLSVWYWSRVVLDAKFARSRPEYQGLARRLPRLMGLFTLLLPAVPIWRAANQTGPKLALIGGCLALAALFWVFVTHRREWMPRLAAGTAVNGFAFSNAWQMPAGRIALVSIVTSLALFVTFVSAPLFIGRWLGAVPILFIAAANTVFFGSVAVFASGATGVRIDAVALACAAAFSFWNDNHDVHVVPVHRKPARIDQVFSVWVTELSAQRHVHGHTRSRAPVLLVAAEGGGIRAGYWTAKVLSALSDADPEFAPHVFMISGISGGSLGAAVYAGLRRDLEVRTDLQGRAKKILGSDFLAPVIARLVTGDFAQWFLPVPVRIFDRSRAMEDGFAAAYAAGVTGATSRTSTFIEPFFDLGVSATTGVPALVLTATSVERGARVVTAPFTWTVDQIPDTQDYRELAGNAIPSLAAAVHNSARFTYVSPAGLVRTAQGAYQGHVVDGGYFDPTGADTLLDITRALEPLARSANVELISVFITNGRIAADANRRALDYSSGTMAAGATPAAAAPVNQERRIVSDAMETTDVAVYSGELQAVKILGELFAPVRAVLAARDAHGRVAVVRQQQSAGAVAFGFCEGVSADSAADTGGQEGASRNRAPLDPPLGWQLSVPMVDQLDAYWDKCPVNEVGRKAIANLLRR